VDFSFHSVFLLMLMCGSDIFGLCSTGSACIVFIPLRSGAGERWLDSPIPEWHRKHLSFTAWSWSIKNSGFLDPMHCSSCKVSGGLRLGRDYKSCSKYWKLTLLSLVPQSVYGIFEVFLYCDTRTLSSV